MHEVLREILIKQFVTERDMANIISERDEVPRCFGTIPQGNESAWAQGCKECCLHTNSDACSNATAFVRVEEKRREGLTKLEAQCPKCKATSGNDWTQCKGDCPMLGSPHYKRFCLKKDDRGPYIWDREHQRILTFDDIRDRLNQK